VDLLLPRADIFDAVHGGGVERARELLAAEPALARAVDPDGRPVLFSLRADDPHADAMIDLLLAHGADLDARDPRGRTFLDLVVAWGSDALAAKLRARGASNG
jgi:ankyrin repeat protein